MTRHFDQQAFQRAAVLLRIGAHYSSDELNAAAAARRALLYSLEQAGADIDAGQAIFEALDAAVAILSRLTQEIGRPDFLAAAPSHEMSSTITLVLAPPSACSHRLAMGLYALLFAAGVQ
jgi:hypothetical protein